jgi:hypothetical protein
VVLNERKHVGGAKDGDEAVAPDKKKRLVLVRKQPLPLQLRCEVRKSVL